MKKPCYFCGRTLNTDKALQCMGVGSFAHYICYRRYDAPSVVRYFEEMIEDGIKLSRGQKTRLRRAMSLTTPSHMPVSNETPLNGNVGKED